MTTPLLDHVLPQDLQAEQATLGAMLMEHDAISRVADLLKAADFYSPQHQTLFGAVMQLFHEGKPVDLVTMQSRLQDLGRLELAGGRSYLISLMEPAPTAAAVEYYAEIVRKKATLRALIQAGEEVKRLAQDGESEDVAALVARAGELVAGVARAARSTSPLRSARQVREADRRVEWLVPEFIPRARLVVLAGDSGEGKSLVAQALCAALAEEGTFWLGPSVCGPALSVYVDMEMGEDLVNERQDLLGFSEAALDAVRYLFDPEWRLGPGFAAAMQPIVKEHHPALIVLDNLSELLPDNCDENSNSDVRPIMRGLAQFARDHGVTIMLIHHYRKTQALGSNAPAQRLRGASAIRQVADAVLALNPTRDEMTKLVIHAKARHGQRQPSFMVRFDETAEGTLALSYAGRPDAEAVGKAAACETLVLEALSTAKRSRSELVALAAEKSIGKNTCDKCLAAMAKAERIVPDKVGREVFYVLA